MRIETYVGDRQVLWPLFALAEDSAEEIAATIGLGEVWVARKGGRIVGKVQLVGAELKSLAVASSHQRQGIGAALVGQVVALALARGFDRLTVATAAADTGNLRFYQRCGFRMERVVRDAFTPAKGYAEGLTVDGIPLRDQVVLSIDLRPPLEGEDDSGAADRLRDVHRE